MSKKSDSSRRDFLKKAATGAALMSFPTVVSARVVQPYLLERKIKVIAPNDTIRLGVIGMGIQGGYDLRAALEVPGVEMAAACDLYDGRLTRAKEVYGKDLYTTRSYQELLAREDIDAVIVATSDHWHDHISIAAMKAGKAVYCEKPMVHKLDEGKAVIQTQKETGKVLQVGSQRVSSVLYEKASEFIKAGDIGNLVMVEINNDRFSSGGAWQYSIPTDASMETVDWDNYLGDAPKRAYDPLRFFRWRNYQDYGTGGAGDMFVHFFSGLHVITGAIGPNRIYATGGLNYWKDGRDVPDNIMGYFDYPETKQHAAFNVQMRVNFADGGGGGSDFRFVGDEGVLNIGYGKLSLTNNKLAKAPSYGGYDSLATFSKKQQKEFEKWYKAHYSEEDIKRPESYTKEFTSPEGYSEHVDHFTNFFNAMKGGDPVVEDAVFGMRAAGPALASNLSYFEQKIVHWDPEKMEVREN